MEVKTSESKSRRKNTKKRSAKDMHLDNARNDVSSVDILEHDGDDNMNEPTMGEKLEKLQLLEDDRIKDSSEKVPSPEIKPPSADSVHILLKQALNAEDHQLLLSCLNTRDDKVVSNSVAQLSPANVLKLLNSLVSITQSRGGVLVCALPWLRSLLVQHASSIMAQESSLSILNSLYQLIESRTSTFASAIQLSTSIDFLLTGVVDNEDEEESIPPSVIFEDRDTDDEESEADMESDTENQTELTDGADFQYDSDGSDVMSQ